MIKKIIEEGTIDPDVSILTVLPDCPHVGKSVKASFCNWWLKLNNECGNIGLFTYFLSDVGYICHTIIPELDKFTDNNRLGMYPSPASVSLVKFGWLLFLSWDSKLASSTLYRAWLHSPVDKISVVKKESSVNSSTLRE